MVLGCSQLSCVPTTFQPTNPTSATAMFTAQFTLLWNGIEVSIFNEIVHNTRIFMSIVYRTN